VSGKDIQNLVAYPKENVRYGDQDVNWRMILKWILKGEEAGDCVHMTEDKD
jgi:hypothetical protein